SALAVLGRRAALGPPPVPRGAGGQEARGQREHEGGEEQTSRRSTSLRKREEEHTRETGTGPALHARRALCLGDVEHCDRDAPGQLGRTHGVRRPGSLHGRPGGGIWVESQHRRAGLVPALGLLGRVWPARGVAGGSVWHPPRHGYWGRTVYRDLPPH